MDHRPGAAPRADPFSHSMPGAPWIAHEWLSEVLLTLAFRLGGWSGVALMTGAAAASAALIVGLAAARELRGALLVATVGLGLGLMTASLLARPHMLALPIAAAWSAGLIAARDRGRAPPLALVPLMTAWANMHGGFIFGLMLIGPFALEALAEAPAGARLAAARAWTLFGLAALAAALINPYGVEALHPAVPPDGDREPVAHQRMAAAGLQRVVHSRPQQFHDRPKTPAFLLAFFPPTSIDVSMTARDFVATVLRRDGSDMAKVQDQNEKAGALTVKGINAMKPDQTAPIACQTCAARACRCAWRPTAARHGSPLPDQGHGRQEIFPGPL